MRSSILAAALLALAAVLPAQAQQRGRARQISGRRFVTVSNHAVAAQRRAAAEERPGWTQPGALIRTQGLPFLQERKSAPARFHEVDGGRGAIAIDESKALPLTNHAALSPGRADRPAQPGVSGRTAITPRE